MEWIVNWHTYCSSDFLSTRTYFPDVTVNRSVIFNHILHVHQWKWTDNRKTSCCCCCCCCCMTKSFFIRTKEGGKTWTAVKSTRKLRQSVTTARWQSNMQIPSPSPIKQKTKTRPTPAIQGLNSSYHHIVKIVLRVLWLCPCIAIANDLFSPMFRDVSRTVLSISTGTPLADLLFIQLSWLCN